MNRIITLAAAIGLLLGSHTAFATDTEKQVNIRPDVPGVVVETEDGPVTIERIEDTDHEITGYFAKTSRACPPFCIQPAQAADGVATIGELELLEMLADVEARVIDARTVDWHAEETIPGSVNIPYTEIAGRLDELGCVSSAGTWTRDAAPSSALLQRAWCGRPPPPSAPSCARPILPEPHLLLMRACMQAWKILALDHSRMWLQGS